MSSICKGVCAVVGAGPGLGGSVALRFAKEGFKIAAFNRTAKSFAPTAKALTELGATYSFYECDATDEVAVKTKFKMAKEELGSINVLVYNAGGGGFGIKPLDINPQEFKKSFEVSCLGALLCSQAVLPDMLSSSGELTMRTTDDEYAMKYKKRGTILFSSATSAFRGSATTGQFACGKHALRALSQSIAKAYASKGIHVCHVRLDCILDTPNYRARFPDAFNKGTLASTQQIAETYFQLYQQSTLAMSNEIDIRPFQEGWSC